MEDVALLRPVALDLLALDYKYLQQDHWANATTAANSSFAVAKIQCSVAPETMARRTIVLGLILGLLAAANAVPFDFYYLILMV